MVLYVKDTLYSYRELKVSFYLQTKFQKTCSGTQQSVRFLGVNWLELFFIWARFPRFTKSKILQGCMEMWQWHLLSSWANSFVRKMLLLEDISRMDVVPVGDCLPFINCLLSAVRHSLWITSRKEVTSQEVKIENSAGNERRLRQHMWSNEIFICKGKFSEWIGNLWGAELLF